MTMNVEVINRGEELDKEKIVCENLEVRGMHDTLADSKVTQHGWKIKYLQIKARQEAQEKEKTL